MGTRSLTVMQDTDGKEIAVLYGQFDGYLDGHGAELQEFLSDFKVVNGFNSKEGKVANGGECLAAQIIAHFKEDTGQFYLYPANTRDCGEEYIYIVSPKEGKGVFLEVKGVYRKETLYKGHINEFMPTTLEEK